MRSHSGHLAGAAVDVYSAEPMAADNPLRDAPNVVLTPHLGASTSEAQDRVGLEMAEQVVMALAGVTPPYAVNAPAVSPETAPRLRPYVELGRRLAILARQLAPGAFDALSLTYAGEIAAGECAPIRTAALAGMLEAVTDQRVNAVNADLVARRARAHRPRGADRVIGAVGIAGRAADRPRRRRADLLAGGIDGAWSPSPGGPRTASRSTRSSPASMLVTRHEDRPGIVGAVGTILAEAGINISLAGALAPLRARRRR